MIGMVLGRDIGGAIARGLVWIGAVAMVGAVAMHVASAASTAEECLAMSRGLTLGAPLPETKKKLQTT